MSEIENDALAAKICSLAIAAEFECTDHLAKLNAFREVATPQNILILLREHRDTSAQGADARPVAIYQFFVASQGWIDISKESYETAERVNSPGNRRIVYATRDAAPSDANDDFKEYRRGLMEAFHLANMIKANRQGRTAEETCAYLVSSLAMLANGGDAIAPTEKTS